MSNLLSTTSGPRWNDFEDVCFGPVAWDVVGVVEDARERKGDAFAAQVLAAYGRQVDPILAQLVQEVQRLYGTLWQRYVTSTFAPRAMAEHQQDRSIKSIMLSQDHDLA
jgi:Ser/Thr protein kinase RdoA (MazF antagonist)